MESKGNGFAFGKTIFQMTLFIGVHNVGLLLAKQKLRLPIGFLVTIVRTVMQT